ncbi:UDP-glucose-hexose-1-phosphate uridylyltransferase [Acididesulfobacillus acetoxydans]|uniref:Galactose-1-phosphate uridylyltransferase n=1 Tax=Acididesulfobacillus acetoxydans TaxID=1561005 RepID=A0A8S0XX09_9FIRM|nr:galactose-1-phosphate uridylyltransferase [Acididesulfobacillus acetoxydans]CAA7601397.1 UDP-glucose-hexose-1-phosphate uridylyltransferase [Acididesulfobacillus acetoxydans]CEJ08828.1 Galactose-1-phosphate uridylyltransferase [Acididesulfobacillus acetoxydans]
MTELRYNPLLGDWTMVADKRQFRPNMPQDFCPFCPGSGKVPEHYEVLKYDNDFPALMPEPPEPSVAGMGPYRVEKAYGKCEVILYSPDHRATLPELSLDHIVKLVNLWTKRYVELNRDPLHQYVMIFENRGEEVGVTMPHPHGQIYAYSKMPLKIKTELANCREYYSETGHCLLCDMNRTEEEFGKRIIYENEHFVAYLPFFTDYPFGLFIVSKAHRTGLDEFTEAEKRSLALSLKEMIGAMDTLFDRPFPYMMVLHQRAAHEDETRDYYHFHIEFYPPLREESKIKYYASSEMGAWAACNTQAVEQTAEALRQAYQKYLEKTWLTRDAE